MSKAKLSINVKPGNILCTFDKKESNDIENRWLNIFCKKKQGLNTKDYKWHIFSGNGYPSLEDEDEEARKEYSKHSASKYIVMGNDQELAVLTDQRPEEASLCDYYVFPENMAWTMAFTHEDGWLGPYFAKHPNYEALMKESDTGAEKERQKEMARIKGWC